MVEGSKLAGGTVNVGVTEKSGNVAMGNKSSANMATTQIKDSQILGGTVNLAKQVNPETWLWATRLPLIWHQPRSRVPRSWAVLSTPELPTNRAT